MDLKYFIALLVSFGALIFSFLNYKRSRRFENENHIFKLKIDIYSKIIAELSNLINELQDNILIGKEFIKNRSDENYSKLNEHADEIDKTCFQFNDFIVNNSLIIPEQLVTELQKFCDKVINEDAIDGDFEDIQKKIKRADKFLDILVNDADAISIMLRKDLHIEELNTSLYRRLR